MDTRRATDDLTARARIRDSAFRLIATEGARGATLRAIAKEAGVSSPLVLHHFGSKQGVIEAVEEWVQTQLRASTADDGDSSDPSRAHARRTEEFAALMSAEPLLASYIRRMLLESSEEGLDLFSRMVTDGAERPPPARRLGNGPAGRRCRGGRRRDQPHGLGPGSLARPPRARTWRRRPGALAHGALGSPLGAPLPRAGAIRGW